jgi:hypothetical protein
MAIITGTWQDFAYYLRPSHFYKIKFYDRDTGTTRNEEGWVWRKGRVGFEFEVIQNDLGITTTMIRYRDVRAAQEML